MTSPADAGRMSSLELRASFSLASLFALRMLGLFLILPVFAVHARQLSGGDSQTLVGMALAAYGLTQAFLHIPYGMASDRYGRKRMIVIGLLLFALGSFLAAWASDIHAVILGRAMQGMGAIAAPVTALAADITREEHRTKAMAMIGGSIGLAFAVSLVHAPGPEGGPGRGAAQRRAVAPQLRHLLAARGADGDLRHHSGSARQAWRPACERALENLPSGRARIVPPDGAAAHSR